MNGEPFNYLYSSLFSNDTNYQSASQLFSNVYEMMFEVPSDFSPLVLKSLYGYRGEQCSKIVIKPSTANGVNMRLGSVYDSECRGMDSVFNQSVGFAVSISDPSSVVSKPSQDAINFLNSFKGDYAVFSAAVKSSGVEQYITAPTSTANMFFLLAATCAGTNECSGNGVCMTVNSGCRCFSPYYGPRCDVQLTDLPNNETFTPEVSNVVGGGCILYLKGEDNPYATVGNYTVFAPSFSYGPGVLGRAFDFNFTNTEAANFSISNFPFPADNFTLSFWISSNEPTYIRKGTAFTYHVRETDFGFLIDDTKDLKFALNTTNKERSLLSTSDTWDTTINVHSPYWTHVLVSYASLTGLMKVYVNGSLVNFYPAFKKGLSLPSGGALYIGNQVYPNGTHISVQSNTQFRYVNILQIVDFG